MVRACDMHVRHPQTAHHFHVCVAVVSALVCVDVGIQVAFVVNTPVHLGECVLFSLACPEAPNAVAADLKAQLQYVCLFVAVCVCVCVCRLVGCVGGKTFVLLAGAFLGWPLTARLVNVDHPASQPCLCVHDVAPGIVSQCPSS